MSNGSEHSPSVCGRGHVDPFSRSGDAVRVRQIGKTLLVISAAVTKGIPLILSDGEGRVSNVGGATGDGIVGVTEEGPAGSGGTSGDTITAFLQIRRA